MSVGKKTQRVLALVCCLVLVCSCLPMSAWAAADVTGEGSFKDADAKSVVAAIFIALGVSPGEDATDFNTLVDECVAAVAPGGTVSMYVIPYSDTQVQSLVSAEFVDTVRSWIFENVALTEIPEGYALYGSKCYPILPALDLATYPYVFIGKSDSDFKVHVVFSATNLRLSQVSEYGQHRQYILDGTEGNYVWTDTGKSGYFTYTTNWDVYWSNFDLCETDGTLHFAGSNIVTSSDLSLGDIAESSVSMAEGYPAWCGVPYTVDGATYYALQINDSYDLTIQQNQSGSQSGLSNAFIPSTITGLFIDVTPDLLDGPVDTYIPGDVDRNQFWFVVTVTGTGQFDDSFTAEITDPELTDLGATAGGSTLTVETTGRIRLTVSAAETAESITIKFTSVQDPSISVSYTLTNASTSSGSGGATEPDDSGDSTEPTLSEKDEAASGGDEGVNELTGAIPNYSEGFMDALQSFSAAMSYTGTDAKLKIPTVVFPQLGSLVPEFQIADEMELDFGQYVSMMPESLMILVQSLLTIALIVYCFKELCSTISYVLTLKGGGA